MTDVASKAATKSGGFRQVSKAEARSHLSRDERIARLEGVVLTLESAEQYVEEISRLWRDAQSTFLMIGRYLIQAKIRLGLEEKSFQDFVDNHLPFGYQVSYQLRKVAEAIDGNRLPITELPSSYATIYQFATMEPDELERARRAELIRPNVKRREVIDFKRMLARERVVETAAPPPAQRLAQLERRRATLIAQRDRVLVELAEVERELTADAPREA